MKNIYWVILLSVVVIIAAGFFIYNKLKKNISFDFQLDENASNILGFLQSRTMPGAASRTGLYFDIPLTTVIKNKGAAKVVLENIAGSVSYNGEPILQTKANSPALANVEIAKKSSESITDNVQVLVNENTIKFFQELLKGNKPKVLYNFSTIIMGKPKTFTNSTTINQ